MFLSNRNFKKLRAKLQLLFTSSILPELDFLLIQLHLLYLITMGISVPKSAQKLSSAKANVRIHHSLKTVFKLVCGNNEIDSTSVGNVGKIAFCV